MAIKKVDPESTDAATGIDDATATSAATDSSIEAATSTDAPEADTAKAATSNVKQVEHTEFKPTEGDKQEYLNARKRTKTIVKVVIAVIIVAVLAVIGFGVFAAVNPTAAGKVKVSTSSSSLAGKYYEDVQTLLAKDGFTNIELRAEGDLKIGLMHDEGDVDTVSIDGKTTFSSGDQFDKDAKIVIAYHSYPAGSSASNKSSSSTSSSSTNASNTNTSSNTSNANNASNTNTSNASNSNAAANNSAKAA